MANDTTMDFDFDKWLNDIGAAGTPGAATFLSPAPAPAPASASALPHNQDVSALPTLPTLPVLDDALLAAGPTNPAVIQPPVATADTFITNEIANPNVPPFGVTMMGPGTTSMGPFGFGVGTSGGPSGPSGLGLGFATGPESRVAALKAFFNDAKALYAEVEGWQDMVPLENRDARVLAGNKTHQLAMQVCLFCLLFCWNRLVVCLSAICAENLPCCVVDRNTPRYLPRRQARSSRARVCCTHSRTLRRVCRTEHGYRVGCYYYLLIHIYSQFSLFTVSPGRSSSLVRKYRTLIVGNRSSWPLTTSGNSVASKSNRASA